MQEFCNYYCSTFGLCVKLFYNCVEVLELAIVTEKPDYSFSKCCIFSIWFIQSCYNFLGFKLLSDFGHQIRLMFFRRYRQNGMILILKDWLLRNLIIFHKFLHNIIILTLLTIIQKTSKIKLRISSNRTCPTSPNTILLKLIQIYSYYLFINILFKNLNYIFVNFLVEHEC